MRRRTFDLLMTLGGLVVAVVLFVGSGLLFWAHQFADSNVSSQLAQQQIFFPAKGSPALTTNPEIAKNLTKYAGQRLTTGAQAADYANHFIAVHLREVAGGQTYSQVSNEVQALKATDPTSPRLAALNGQEQTLFQGETLRGLLLNAYGYAVFGEIAWVAAWVTLGGGIVLLFGVALGVRHFRRTPAGEELFARIEPVPQQA
ncbi:MAG TPA: hypothetical protein VF288_03955 [Mycobacteriales bacterium]